MIFCTSFVRLVGGFVAVLTALLAGSGCDASFDAFEETDRAYSVFGILDANADTQFVRVEPIRDSTFVGGDELNARVTSENIETGETVVWHDSTFFIGVNGVPVHNVWTDADFELGARYRFTAERERDGATSAATVTLPSAFAEPEVTGGLDLPQTECGESEPPINVQIDGLEHLVAVRVDYDYLARVCAPVPSPPVRRQTTVYPLADASRTSANSWTVEVFWGEHIPDVVDFRVVDIRSFRVTVAAGGESWPEFAEGDLPGDPTDVPQPPLGVGTNVENGIGFLGGAFTRTVEVPIEQP